MQADYSVPGGVEQPGRAAHTTVGCDTHSARIKSAPKLKPSRSLVGIPAESSPVGSLARGRRNISRVMFASSRIFLLQDLKWYRTAALDIPPGRIKLT